MDIPDGRDLPVVDVLDDVVESAAEAVPPPVPAKRGRGNLFLGVLEIAAGLVAMLAGASWLKDSPMILRAVLVIAGVAAIYTGVRNTVHAVRPGADVAWGLAVLWLVLLIAFAILAPVLPLGEHQNTAKTLAEPLLKRPQIFSKHPLGTNNYGLDMLARIAYGARASLTMGVLAVAIGMTIGGTFGMIAGYLKGKFDWVVNVLNNTMLAFPPLVLLLALATVMDKNVKNLALALGVLAIPVNFRLARANTMAVAEQGFVTAARSMGASRRRVLFRELFPNVAPQLLSYGLILMAILIVAEASLSYLGLGVQPPTPSWGNMIAEGNGGQFEMNPHVVLAPGLVVFLTVFAFNLVGGRARQKWDRTSG